MAKAKPTRAMSLIILFLPYKNTAGAAMSEKLSGRGVVPDFWRVSRRNSFPRQGAGGRGSPAGATLHPANSTTIDLYQTKTIRDFPHTLGHGRQSRACAMSQAMISALSLIEPRRPERPSWPAVISILNTRSRLSVLLA